MDLGDRGRHGYRLLDFFPSLVVRPLLKPSLVGSRGCRKDKRVTNCVVSCRVLQRPKSPDCSMNNQAVLNIPSVSDLAEAHDRIRPHIHRTPILTSTFVDEASGARIFFKCENLQRIGAFKIRGACNAILSMSDTDLSQGVVAHSSGNHAQAVALAARIRGASATIVMPSNSAKVKLAAVRDYGANVVLCEPTAEAREVETARVVAATGAALIHPFNDPRIICGQGTAARELLQDVPDIDLLLAPVGGGGLLSGTILAAQEHARRPDVIGIEPTEADDAFRSFKLGELQPSTDPKTIADGLRTGLGNLTFSMIRSGAEAIVTVEEKEIVDAMRALWMRMKIVIEASAAVPVAAILQHREDFVGKRIGVILSGGNVDLDDLPWLG